MKEEWRDIPGYEGLYQASDKGRVKSLERMAKHWQGGERLIKEKILKPGLSGTKNHKRYFVVLSKHAKRKTIPVHVLVAMSFLGHTPCGYKIVVDHINNNPLDNRLENLQLIPQRENTTKDTKKGTSKYTGVTWHKRNKKWLSQIHINGKNKYIGQFTDELEAYKAYKAELAKIKKSPN